MTWIELTIEEARAAGRTIDIATAEMVLWEKTAFPMGNEAEVRAALREYFADPKAFDAKYGY